ncbi:MAG: cupin [Bacteroidetes bacterium]|nr:cupin [Bacteroidota bacterium]NCQ11177.1 cupin [Bacteroidota bacterium]
MNFKKATLFNIVNCIDYVSMSIVIKTIIKRNTGSISVYSFDIGETFSAKLSPYDSFIQIIEGAAEINIDYVNYQIETGNSIIVPAHSRNTITAIDRFKMLVTIIKSGYEEVS